MDPEPEDIGEDHDPTKEKEVDPNCERMRAMRLKYCPEECYSAEDIEIAWILESAL